MKAILLPAAVRQQPHVRLDLEDARLVAAVGAFEGAAGPVVARERLGVAARELGVRCEGSYLKRARGLFEKRRGRVLVCGRFGVRAFTLTRPALKNGSLCDVKIGAHLHSQPRDE